MAALVIKRQLLASSACFSKILGIACLTTDTILTLLYVTLTAVTILTLLYVTLTADTKSTLLYVTLTADTKSTLLYRGKRATHVCYCCGCG